MGSTLDEPKAKKAKPDTTAKSTPVNKTKSTMEPATNKSKSVVKKPAAVQKSTLDPSTPLSDKRKKAPTATESKSKKIKSSSKDWSTLSLPELKKELEVRGLSKTGSKLDLVERLTHTSVGTFLDLCWNPN